MEIDITRFVETAETHDFSASVAELGKNAGKITWNNAKDEAKSTRLIKGKNRDEFESWVRGFGAWDDKEIKSWTLTECNALLIHAYPVDTYRPPC